MKKEEISDALNLLADDLIEETAAVRGKKRKYRKELWGLASVACLAVIVYAGIKMFPLEAQKNMPQLPALTISANTSEAMGYEGYLAFDASELINDNPWNESLELSTLPVYQNPLTHDENFIFYGVDDEKMEALLLDVADRLGLDTDTLTITDNPADENIRKKIFSTDTVEIEVNQSLIATIFFTPAVALPDEYRYAPDATYEEYVAVSEYLQGEYADLIGFTQPQVNIRGGDYNIYADQGYSLEFYETGDNAVTQIINYNFNRVIFYNDEDGRISLARVIQTDLSQKLGDYPVITAAKARELLLSGEYFTSSPYDLPGAEYVRKVELVYRTGELETYFMPYYRFYVELPQEQSENGLRSYGAYYVPAVDGAYLEIE